MLSTPETRSVLYNHNRMDTSLGTKTGLSNPFHWALHQLQSLTLAALGCTLCTVSFGRPGPEASSISLATRSGTAGFSSGLALLQGCRASTLQPCTQARDSCHYGSQEDNHCLYLPLLSQPLSRHLTNSVFCHNDLWRERTSDRPET